jgi:RNA polymerase sigma factor (sigma-70 family)
MPKARQKEAPATEGEWSNARLVRECLNGNQEAWSALIDKYKNLIYSVPINYGFSPEEASDLFQSVCLDLLSELPRLREPQALPAWLFRVTFHKCFHLRRQQHHLVLTGDDDMKSPPQADPAEIPEAMLQQTEREQLLRETLAELAPRCRKLIHMLFFEFPARPYEEVAQSMGLATVSIGFIRRRCLELLRKKLDKAGFK